MDKIVGIIFKEKGKIYYFKSNGFKIFSKDNVIVETEKGNQFGKVVFSDIKNVKNIDSLKKVIKIADWKDKEIAKQNSLDSLEAMETAKQLAKDYNLKMTFLSGDYSFDRKQLILTFTADNRVDFRELAKELAALYKTRIELRQIGVRDRAKEISGIGQCGREFCCSTFINNFTENISINSVKNQNLAINPTKINGQCGRLLCCLNYEDEVYTEKRKNMPNIGDEVKTNKGTGTVVSLDILGQKYTVNVPNEGRVEVTLSE